MQPGNDHAKQHATQIADAMEASLNQENQSMIRTEHLMELLEEIANELFLLAQDWEPVDPQRAQRCRTQEQQIRTLGLEFSHLEEVKADEAKSIIKSMRQALHQAQVH